MSNFDFLNNSQYLNLPGCRVLYENAMLAERNYFSDHAECALRVRVVLTQFCILVSELKQAKYPDTVFWMGSYWNQQNRYEFIQILGHRNAALIRKTDAIARSFLDKDLPTREDVYPQMLRNIYILLLWLYQELGMKTTLSEHDYSIQQIPTDPVIKEIAPEIVYSTEQMLSALKIFFPDCNTEKVCGIRRAGDKYLVTDLQGGLILDQMDVPETAFFSEGKAEHLRTRMMEAKKEYDLRTREFILNQSACDRQIVLLELQLEEKGSELPELEKNLRQEIADLEDQKQQNAEIYRDQFALLAGKYDEWKEKYDDLLPADQKKNEIQQQMKLLLKQRADMEETFLAEQGRLLEAVRKLETSLENTEKSMNALNLSAQMETSLMEQLRREVSEKKLFLESVCKQTKKEYEFSQKESVKAIEQYRNTVNNLEVIRTLILAGNMKCQRIFDGLDCSQEIRGGLQIILDELGDIDKGIAVYRENLIDSQIVGCLTQAKENYDNRIRELRDGIRQKEEELVWEKKRYEDLLNSLNEEEQDVSSANVQEGTDISENNVADAGRTVELTSRVSGKSGGIHGYLKWVIIAVICLVVGLLATFWIYTGAVQEMREKQPSGVTESAERIQNAETVFTRV